MDKLFLICEFIFVVFFCNLVFAAIYALLVDILFRAAFKLIFKQNILCLQAYLPILIATYIFIFTFGTILWLHDMWFGTVYVWIPTALGILCGIIIHFVSIKWFLKLNFIKSLFMSIIMIIIFSAAFYLVYLLIGRHHFSA
jgi:hypothetical protein